MRSFLVGMLLLAGFAISQHAAAQGIKFEDLSLSKAIAKAADPANPKLVFIDCYTTWCVPCMEMAKEEFPKKVSGDFFNPRFISVKYDMEKGEGISIKEKYGIIALPTFLILNEKGEEINRVVGKAGAEEFIEKIKAALKPENTVAGLKAAYEKDKSMRTGFPYAKMLYENGRDPSEVLSELFDIAQDFERFSGDYLKIALDAAKFRSPFFRKLMLEKTRMDEAMGTEVVNRYIFDKVRKDMYIIASKKGERYNVVYTPEEVEQVAYTISLLKLDPQRLENHICKIALYVIRKDIDGMIDYYKRYIWRVPADAYKGILEGILVGIKPDATAAQKAAIDEYFNYAGKSYEREAKQYLSHYSNSK